MNKNSKSLIKNTMILSLGTICTKGILFIMVPLFTRWLTQSDYGIFDLIVTYIALFIPIVTLNCGEAIFRFLIDSDSDKKEKTIITNAFVVSVIGFIFSLILTLILYIFIEKFRYLIFYVLILLFAESIYNLLMMTMRGLKKITSYTISNIIFVITMVIGSILFIKVMSLGLPGIMIAYIFGYIISSIYMIIVSKVYKYISIKDFDKKETIQMLKYCLPLIPNAISWWIMDASDRTIVSIFLGTSTNAILAIAHKVPNLCQTLYSVFHISWQENATLTINDKDRDKYYNSIMNNMVTILISISSVVLCTNFIFFNYIFENNYFLGYYQVPILILAIIFSMMAQFIGGIYIAKKNSKVNGLTTCLAAALNIVIHLSLIKFIGIYASTLSTLFAYIFLFIIRYVDIKKEINLSFNKKSITSFMYIFALFVLIYINNIYINISLLFISIILFIIINKNLISSILKKILGRKKYD